MTAKYGLGYGTVGVGRHRKQEPKRGVRAGGERAGGGRAGTRGDSPGISTANAFAMHAQHENVVRYVPRSTLYRSTTSGSITRRLQQSTLAQVKLQQNVLDGAEDDYKGVMSAIVIINSNLLADV